jgi:hypothetical protein
MGTAVALLPSGQICGSGDFIVAARLKLQAGKVGWIFLWLLGVPIPILVILFLVRGCT